MALFSASAPAQRLSFKYYSSSDGLASDNVNRIVPDSRGFLWFCTDAGLSRFDGYEFKNYTQDQGLPSRQINDFLETRDGTYLVATAAGLAVFDPKGKAYRWNILTNHLEQTGAEPPIFTTWYAPGHPDSKMSKSILSLAQASDGTVYAGTFEGLFRFDRAGDGWALTEIESSAWTDKKLCFNALFTDTKGGLWMLTNAAVYRKSTAGDIEEISDLGGNTIFEDRTGRIWVDGGGNPIGIRIYAINESNTPLLIHRYVKRDGLPDVVFANAIAQTDDGKIYVSANGKLCEFLENAGENEPKFRQLQDDVINTGSAAMDKSGNLWVGIAGKGAWKHSPNSFSVFDERDGVPSDRITSIFGNQNDDVFFVSGNHRIIRAGRDKFEAVVPFGWTATSRGDAFSGFQLGDGWWVAAKDQLRHYTGIDKFADLSRITPSRVFDRKNGLSGAGVNNLFHDSHGNVWFSLGESEVPVYRLDGATGNIDAIPQAGVLPKFDGAISFSEDASGNIWIGFFQGQLGRYKDGKIRLFTAVDGYTQGSVSGIFSDRQGHVWLATSSRGLFRIDNPDTDVPVFTNLSTAAGLSSNQTFCLAEDNFGKLYVGTAHGINRLDPETQKIKVYTTADGLPNNYVTGCYSDKKGDLWFAANDLLIRYSPPVDKEEPPPPVFIDGISVNGIARPISELGEIEIRGLELAPDERQVQIRFFGLSFGTGDVLHYQYKIAGEDWTAPDLQRTVALNLSPGSYDVAIRAVNGDGTVSAKPATVNFRILAPFWQRWWFIALSAFGIGLTLFAISRSRTAKRNLAAAVREERLLELQRVRTRIANDLHDDIGSSLTQIAVLSEVARGQAASLSNELDAPLERIKTVSKDLVAAMSDVVWAINPNKDFLHDLVQRMRRFASDVFSGKDIRFEFHPPADENNLMMGANIRREVLAIFKETVNNAVKYSDCTIAKTDFRIEENWLILEVSDDGKGFDMDEILNDDFSPEQGGNGLINIRRRAEELGGLCEITSATGEGTMVSIRIPL